MHAGQGRINETTVSCYCFFDQVTMATCSAGRRSTNHLSGL